MCFAALRMNLFCKWNYYFMINFENSSVTRTCLKFVGSCNFAVCGVLFWARFYSRDFILEMVSMRYVNMFGFVLLFVFYTSPDITHYFTNTH